MLHALSSHPRRGVAARGQNGPAVYCVYQLYTRPATAHPARLPYRVTASLEHLMDGHLSTTLGARGHKGRLQTASRNVDSPGHMVRDGMAWLTCCYVAVLVPSYLCVNFIPTQTILALRCYQSKKRSGRQRAGINLKLAERAAELKNVRIYSKVCTRATCNAPRKYNISLGFICLGLQPVKRETLGRGNSALPAPCHCRTP